MGYRLDTLADSRRNNLRIVRLVAASAVIFSHSFIVNFGIGAIAREPLRALTGISCGELAVNIFFIASGFLIGRSLMRGRDPIDFVVSRLLRIYPGLICAVLAMGLLLGPMVSELGINAYFRDQWLYRFIAFNATMFSPWRFTPGLPGTFAHLPYPGVVNASLWSLPWELWMYASLLGLYLIRGLGRAYPVILCVIALAYATMVLNFWEMDRFLALGIRLLAIFHAGVAAYRYRKRIILSWPMLIGLSIVMILVSFVTQSALLLPVWLAYAVLFIAYNPRLVFERWCNGPDYSYGIYIYAYAVQQTLVWQFGPMAVFPSFMLSWGLTMPLALLSWHFVEKPALNFKNRLRSSRPRSMQAAVPVTVTSGQLH